MVCDYNGWNDAPEDEREALDLLEPTLASTMLVVLSNLQRNPAPAAAPETKPHRRAA
jgi:hypothetical protein